MSGPAALMLAGGGGAHFTSEQQFREDKSSRTHARQAYGLFYSRDTMVSCLRRGRGCADCGLAFVFLAG